ncbi:hypothetical protein PVAG01_01920 [Phlyctema vagabunda]|uniref:Stealth protein CR1 conserved region 1 domain-containing protein n=1 Tax=Phlyctema vagabunda TaxID=108571 RepID=A0ABR4PYT2_9HELO
MPRVRHNINMHFDHRPYQSDATSKYHEKPWQRAKSRNRRIYLIITLLFCFFFWQFCKPTSDPEYPILETQHTSKESLQENARRYPPPPIRGPVPNAPPEPPIDAPEPEKRMGPDASVQIPVFELKQPAAGNKKLEDVTNYTPEEEDDTEETDLKRIAVLPKDKEPLSAADGLAVHASGTGSEPDSIPKGRDPTRFPTYSEYASQAETADSLPDIIHMPFEDTTMDVILEGWEDEWFAEAKFDANRWGNLKEPKIDFVYTWVNGSDVAFQDTIYPYELNSSLNDQDGQWLRSHRLNRYRDWDELRFSVRSIEKHAATFRNKIQILVNAIGDETASRATMDNPSQIVGRQVPLWMKEDQVTQNVVEILSQEDFFDEKEAACLPTFNSLTIENQIYNTKSDTDRFFAMSDDMLLGKAHSASDLYSPLFGATMGFKTNGYNTRDPPTDTDARRFGEKPYLIYTSWLLNRRFGERKRKGQVHFGHSLSRSVTREAINSFPRPALQSTCQRFRGETGFQLYSWFVAFHYTIERHREALLWSYIVLRSDQDGDGNLDWSERQAMMTELEDGISQEGNSTFRTRQYYKVGELLEEAGLEAPKVNLDTLWTSLDGPAAIQNIDCQEFDVNECIAPGFSSSNSDKFHKNHVFSTASIFDRMSRQEPKCGDCLIKLVLNRAEQGYEPLLPRKSSPAWMRELIIKALKKYQYTIIEPDALFVMVTDAEQVKNVLLKRLVKDQRQVGQLCLNDDVATGDRYAISQVRKYMIRLLRGIAPDPSQFEATFEEGREDPDQNLDVHEV